MYLPSESILYKAKVDIYVKSLVGSLLLSPGLGVHKILFVPSKGLFLQSCISSGSSIVGLMVISSKRAYAIPTSAAPRAPSQQQSTADPQLHRRHSDTQRQVWISLCQVWCTQGSV